MMGSSRPPKSARTAEREAFFIDFAHAVRDKFPSLTLMVTGGFRTRAGMAAALNSGACDLIGLGRPAIANPSFPKEILDKDVPEEKAQLFLNDVRRPWLAKYVPALGAGAESVSVSPELCLALGVGGGLKS
jgi:2,4-dienoyl-CoA reductase-like NADH-dependent reductase (Old Yellow Enzyme family)